MKNSLLFITRSLLCVLLISCKKDSTSTCQWSNTLLDGKTFMITKIVEVTGGNSSDVTSQRLSDPCQSGARIAFSGRSETVTVPSGCTNNYYPSRSFSLTTENGTDYLVETPAGSSTVFKTEVSAHGCADYTTVTDYTGSGGPVQYITYTAQ